MNTKSLFVCFSIVSLSLFAEDAAQPTFKKEKLPILSHVWISEALLYLKAQETGLSYANTPQSISGSPNFTSSSLVQPRFEWNCGLRIDLGYQPKNWFFFAAWTYIQNKAQGTKSTDGTSGFFPILSLRPTNGASTYVTSGNILWKLDTNFGDIGTAFSWKPSKHFILKSLMGLRFASLNQKISVNYGGGTFSEGMDTLSMTNNFFGAGPTIGLSPNIILPKGFSIIGGFTASGLAGGFWIREKETYLNNPLFNETRSIARLKASLDAKVALAWQKEFYYKICVFSLQAGWEWHEMFSQNQLHYSELEFFNPHKNIILRGGFLSLCLGF